MKKVLWIWLWLMMVLVMLAISNYFLNKSVYPESFTRSQLLVATVGMVVLLMCLTGWVKQRPTKWLVLLMAGLLFLLFFIAMAELLIYKYSGVAYEEQTFLHFEWHSLLVGFTIQPFKYISVVLSLLLIGFVLAQAAPRINLNRRSVSVALVALLAWGYGMYSTSVGRLLINYHDFNESQQIIRMSAEAIEPLHEFNIRPVPFNNDFLTAEFKAEPKNLIVVYLESFSRGFVSPPQYPELTPRIEQLIATHGEFKNYQSTAKFTMQGLMSSMCGLVPKLAAGNNISVDQMPYQKLPCLTDVLHQLGYQQEFMGGARKAFSNKESFLRSKQFDQVYGWLDYAKPKSYQTNDWGLQDSDLFEFATQRIAELHQQDQPFHVSMLTLATHLNGNPDPSCPVYPSSDDKFIQGIHCADYLLGQFMDELQAKGLLNQTTVLITSDHGVFPVSLIKQLFGSEFDRNRLLGILVDDYALDQSLPMGLYDMPPLLLTALGIDTNATFINGKYPDEIKHNRYLLRENVLNDDWPDVENCNQEQTIAHPVDPCENQRLVDSVWGYAATFSTETEAVDLQQPLVLKTQTLKQHQWTELYLAGEAQSEQFLVEGYPITAAERKARSHIKVLVYDVEKGLVESRNGFKFIDAHTDYFRELIHHTKEGEKLYFIFTEHNDPKADSKLWQTTLAAIGGEQFHFPEQAYFGVFHRHHKRWRKAEWTSASQDGLNLTFEGLNGISFSDWYEVP